ncbi:MAG: sulfatase [Limisphaerales bacterium]|nr:MAG: sulfatase [Limisphaerales bacterium]KAG0508207.1 MAG: sulfatase [Limisphaerales bacterium]TXT51696.1 MAG: sulfatase [Limisphaerales bacterium]
MVKLAFHLLLACLALSVSAAPAKLNVVLILADDLGWTDLACFGSDFHETPHLDRLAREGMKFTQNYSACTVCSPTRAALMTGKYPARLHITDWIPGLMPDNPKLLVPDWSKQLPLAETTIAKVFQSAGYRTASIGKWHLGNEEFYPEKHGFDVNIAGLNAGSPPTYFSPWRIKTITDGRDGDYLTDRLGEEAAGLIEKWRDQPFFLYLPHFAVHTPIQGRADLVAQYQQKLKPGLRHKNPAYAAMVESLDTAVGRVLTKLDELKLAERTIVAFTADNGGLITRATTTNAPLRLGKASAYEGGVRVPLIVHWPGVTKPGSVSDTPTITMDLFPTLLEAAGLKPPPATSPTGASGRDGVSLVPLLRGTSKLTRTELFWHYPHHQHYQLGGATPYSAIRSGDFKLIEFFNDLHVELYNLREDLGEARDLAAAQPLRVAELRARLHAWRKEVGAQMPTPNPNYNPAKPEYTPTPPKAKKKGKK